MIAGMHEALADIVEGRDAAGLDALVPTLRRFEKRAPGSGLAALADYLDAYPQFRAGLCALARRLLSDDSAPALYAETGILANTGFFTELNRRIVGRLLPPARDASLRGQFGAIFDRGTDAEWLARIPPDAWCRLVDSLTAGQGVDWDPAWRGITSAIHMLSVRVAAMGVEPELLRHYHVPRAHENPFLAQDAEIRRWLDGVEGAPGASPDAQQALVLLAQCRDVVGRVRRSARQTGASLALAFLLRRLEQSLARLEQLVELVAHRDDTGRDARAARMALAVRLATAEASSHDVGEHWHASTGLLALLATENAARTGEHYVTRTRGEYRHMFRSALGAGAIIGAMALVKTGLSALHLPPLVEALAYSFNYAIGFVLIYVLHFTIATKQPAMTAQTIAGHLSAAQGGRLDEEAAGRLVASVSRTQVVAVLGNVLLAAPVAALLLAMLQLAGMHLPAGKTDILIGELHPLASPALFHAAIAGLWLFVAGLVSGYVDNLAAYERLAGRVQRIRWLDRLLGPVRHERLSLWLEDNIGGISGNVFFGFALGLTGFVGLILGLPLDIRHVTFSAANLSLAITDASAVLALHTVAVAAVGVALIALVNVGTSFALAFWVAARSRDLPPGSAANLLRAVARRLREAPLSFLLPPRGQAPD